jgi:hypothetical protein
MEISYPLNTLRLKQELATACCKEFGGGGGQKFTAFAKNRTSIPRSLTRC